MRLQVTEAACRAERRVLAVNTTPNARKLKHTLRNFQIAVSRCVLPLRAARTGVRDGITCAGGGDQRELLRAALRSRQRCCRAPHERQSKTVYRLDKRQFGSRPCRSDVFKGCCSFFGRFGMYTVRLRPLCGRPSG